MYGTSQVEVTGVYKKVYGGVKLNVAHDNVIYFN